MPPADVRVRKVGERAGPGRAITEIIVVENRSPVTLEDVEIVEVSSPGSTFRLRARRDRRRDENRDLHERG